MTKTTLFTSKKHSSYNFHHLFPPYLDLVFIIIILTVLIFIKPTAQTTPNNTLSHETIYKNAIKLAKKSLNKKIFYYNNGETKSLLNNLKRQQNSFINIKNKRMKAQENLNNIFIHKHQKTKRKNKSTVETTLQQSLNNNIYEELNQYDIKNTLKLTIGYLIHNKTENNTKIHAKLQDKIEDDFKKLQKNTTKRQDTKNVISNKKLTEKEATTVDVFVSTDWSKLQKYVVFNEKNIQSTTTEKIQQTNKIDDEFEGSKLYLNKQIENLFQTTPSAVLKTQTTPIASKTTQASHVEDDFDGSKVFINKKIEKLLETTSENVISKTTLTPYPKITQKHQTDDENFEGSKLFINKQIEKFLETTPKITAKPQISNDNEEGTKQFINTKVVKILQNLTENILNEQITTPKVTSTLEEFEGSKLFITKKIEKVLENSTVNIPEQKLNKTSTNDFEGSKIFINTKFENILENNTKKLVTQKTEMDFEGAKLYINKKIEHYLEPTKETTPNQMTDTTERIGFDGAQKFAIKLNTDITTKIPNNSKTIDVMIDGSKTYLSKNIKKDDESSTLDLDYISDESVSGVTGSNTSTDNQIYETSTMARVGFSGAQKYNTKHVLYESKNITAKNGTDKVGFVGSQKILIPTKYEHLNKSLNESSRIGFEGSQKISVKSEHLNGSQKQNQMPFYTPRSISGKYLTNNNNFEDMEDLAEEDAPSESYMDVSSSSTIEESKPPKGPSISSRKQHYRPSPSIHGTATKTNNNVQTKVVEEEHIVSLLGLFELSTRSGDRPEGKSELAAAKLAVKHINKLNLLPGYTLELLTNDTKCDPGVGVDRFFHALYTQRDTRMVMLLGSACSEVTESLAKVVPYWNIVQISFGSTSPVLSDRSEFPLFYRTVAPDSSHNPARIAFVRKFGWDTVTALSQNEDVYSLAINDLVTELERSNITCTATITFAVTDFKDQMKMLRDLDTRIIIGSFSYKIAPKIFCEAYKLGMFGADYAWILQGGPSDAWWTNTTALIDTTDCTPQELAEATEGLILVSSHNSIVGTDPSLSGLTNEMFASELEALDVTMSRYAPQTYDAVWAMALALQGAEQHWHQTEGTTVAHFDYTRKDMADEFLQQLSSLNFSGISGPVSFSGSDRVGTSAFHQVQGGEINTVALFYPASKVLDFECIRCVGLQWAGGQVPIAKRVFKLRVVTIAPAAFLAISSLAIIGITLAIGFLIFNLHFRRLKSIKLSSPRLNNMAAVGCILVYTAVILLGLDHATLQESDHFSTVCTARVYLLSAGFSLAFGSMFTKTYRVHHIFTHSISRRNAGIVKNKLLQDTQLILMICVLLLMDCFIVTLWVIVDPMQRHLRNLTLEISLIDRSVVYQPQVEVCISENTNGWLGALYAYKGLLLIVGVYMAWETRHVKIPALNDSEYIGMSVYSVVITSGIVVVLANLMSEQATLAFVTITMLILISTTSTLCLLFLPKLHAILGDEENTDPVVESMGLKIEYNTRRFVTDDRRELQYRVEVQNRVYRREVAALDLEIGRLEKLLLESVSTTTSSSSSSNSSLTHPRFNKNNHQPEVSIIDELTNMNIDGHTPQPHHPRTTSIGGGLPLLLLSVLPPVIPRASWPSADRYTNRRSVTFSSEPKLDDSKTCIHHEPVIDLLNLRIRHDPSMLGLHNEKPSVLERLKNFFGSKPSVRKTSTASFGNTNSGIAAALKVHMGYIAGLVPNRNTTQTMATSSCNTSSLIIDQLSKRHSTHGQCSSGPTIDITSTSDDRKFSLALCLPNKNNENTNSSEPHVNFDLNPQRKMSTIIHQQSQPILSFRERAKGSPRFPHKIVPTCSLTALEDRRKNSVGGHIGSGSNSRRCSHQPPLKPNQKSNNSTHGPPNCLVGKWRSMEDATFSMPQGMRRGSGALATSCLPLSAGFQPRASSYSPNCDVWATAEFGIPLSEFNINKKRSENTEKQNLNNQSENNN